jgi:hypothetical protein
MADEVDPEATPSKGVLITRGMSIRIPAGGLRIRLGPDPGVDPITLHVALNMWLPWLEIVMANLDEARTQHERLLQTRDTGGKVGEHLVNESRAAMQAMTAAAISFDALYAMAKDRIGLPPSLTQRWRDKGTARYSQVTEVFRRAFCLKKQSTANVRSVAKELYRFRDLAVHPPASYAAPIVRPDLGSATEWRLVTFSFSNAQLAVRAALAYMKILPSRPMERATGPMQQLAKDLLALGDPLFQRWEEQYGPLLDEPADAGPI